MGRKARERKQQREQEASASRPKTIKLRFKQDMFYNSKDPVFVKDKVYEVETSNGWADRWIKRGAEIVDSNEPVANTEEPEVGEIEVEEPQKEEEAAEEDLTEEDPSEEQEEDLLQ